MCVALLFVLFFINRGSQGRTQTQTLSVWFSASRTEFVVFTEPVAIQANFAVGPQQTCIRFILFTLIFFYFILRACLWTWEDMLSGFLPTRGKTLSVCLSQLSGWLLKDEVSTDFYQLLWGHLSPNLLLLQEKKKKLLLLIDMLIITLILVIFFPNGYQFKISRVPWVKFETGPCTHRGQERGRPLQIGRCLVS